MKRAARHGVSRQGSTFEEGIQLPIGFRLKVRVANTARCSRSTTNDKVTGTRSWVPNAGAAKGESQQGVGRAGPAAEV